MLAQSLLCNSQTLFCMSTRKQLEEDLKTVGERIKNHRPDTPKDLLEDWRRAYNEISFELDNLHDDYVSEFTD